MSKHLPLVALAAALLAATPAHAQQGAADYPNKPVKVVVTVPPGGGVDTVTRLVTERLRQKLGQPFVIENKGGAGGNIAAESVFHAEPDGAPAGYAQTYEKKSAQLQASGTLTAPFPGIHGWYWENTTDKEVTVTLKGAGFYNLSHEFRNGQPTKNKTFQ